jgi:hypothetical protein
MPEPLKPVMMTMSGVTCAVGGNAFFFLEGIRDGLFSIADCRLPIAVEWSAYFYAIVLECRKSLAENMLMVN